MLKGLLVTIGDIEGACARRAGGGEVRVIRAEAREATERLARLLRPYFSFVSRIGVLGGCPIACTSEFNLAVPEEKRVRMGSPEELPTALGQLRKVIGLDPFYRLPVQVTK